MLTSILVLVDKVLLNFFCLPNFDEIILNGYTLLILIHILVITVINVVRFGIQHFIKTMLFNTQNNKIETIFISTE